LSEESETLFNKEQYSLTGANSTNGGHSLADWSEKKGRLLFAFVEKQRHLLRSEQRQAHAAAAAAAAATTRRTTTLITGAAACGFLTGASSRPRLDQPKLLPLPSLLSRDSTFPRSAVEEEEKEVEGRGRPPIDAEEERGIAKTPCLQLHRPRTIHTIHNTTHTDDNTRPSTQKSSHDKSNNNPQPPPPRR
jgi:hypothetical protein